MVWNTCMYAVLYSAQEDTIVSIQEDINNKVENSLSIFPNPAKNEINLRANFGAGFLSGTICNVNGKQIKQFNSCATHNGKSIIINRLENLIPGLYFIHVLGENGLFTGKFIKN